MPVHDWTRVEAGIFHAFHTAWTTEIQRALNGGLLPEGFYALVEQHTGFSIADILPLHGSDPDAPSGRFGPAGATAVADAPPRVRRHHTVQAGLLARRRSVAVRHVSGHRLVALVEILSPANKDRPQTVDAIASKVVDALDRGVQVMMIDLLPPSRHDPHGMHDVIRRRLDDSEESYDLPSGEPLTLASYATGANVEIYLEHLAVGGALPEMPLFLSSERYIKLPLEPTYQAAYQGMPAFWREVLEGRQPVTG